MPRYQDANTQLPTILSLDALGPQPHSPSRPNCVSARTRTLAHGKRVRGNEVCDLLPYAFQAPPVGRHVEKCHCRLVDPRIIRAPPSPTA